MKKKVLIVGSFPNFNDYFYGGIHKICYLLKKSSFFETFNVSTFDITNPNSLKKILIVRLIFGIKNLIRFSYRLIIFRPHTVIIFTSNNWGLLEKGIMGIIAKKLKASVIFCPRASETLMERKIFKKFVKFIFLYTDFIVCQGKKINDVLMSEYNVPSSKLIIIKNWTATKQLLNIGYNKKEIVKEINQINMIFVGWLEKTKGIDELLLATRELKKKRINFKLWIVGDGSQAKTMKEFSQLYNLEKQVQFTSWLSEPQLQEIYKICNIFILPSWTEGMPNSMIEAMAAGCVPVVTDVGNISDLVNNGNGVLIKPKNHKELTNKLISLISDKKKLSNLSKTSHKDAEKHFSTTKNIKKLIDIVNLTTNIEKN